MILFCLLYIIPTKSYPALLLHPCARPPFIYCSPTYQLYPTFPSSLSINDQSHPFSYSMLALEARFALLVLFCSLSMQWLAPISGVSAAAISRQPASRRSSSNAARYYQGTSPHSQRVLPWSRHHGRGRGSHHKVFETSFYRGAGELTTRSRGWRVTLSQSSRRRCSRDSRISSIISDRIRRSLSRATTETPTWFRMQGAQARRYGEAQIRQAPRMTQARRHKVKTYRWGQFLGQWRLRYVIVSITHETILSSQ